MLTAGGGRLEVTAEAVGLEGWLGTVCVVGTSSGGPTGAAAAGPFTGPPAPW